MKVEIVQQLKELYEWNYTAENINDCDGCKTEGGKLFSGCLTYEIKKCAENKGFENCAYCDRYPCVNLEKFFVTEADAKVVLDSLRRYTAMDSLKKSIKHKVSFLKWFFSGPLGKWFFTRSALNWMRIKPIRKQLPPLYKVFAIYSRLFFKVTKRKNLAGGRQLFILLSGILRIISRRDYLNLHLPKYEVYLNQYDPRFLQVVGELTQEPPDIQILKVLLSKGDTFIDIGANHGSFSIVASKLVGDNGCIIAVEPQPSLAGAVENSLSANCSCTFRVYQIAVGNSDGEIELLIPRDTSGNAGIYQKHSGTYKHSSVKVPIKRFDEAASWQSFPGQTVVKLDVEGSEFNFLEGARKMITAKRPVLIMETNPSSIEMAGATVEDIKSLLAELGYNQYAEVDEVNKTFSINDLDFKPQRNVVFFIR